MNFELPILAPSILAADFTKLGEKMQSKGVLRGYIAISWTGILFRISATAREL